MQEKRYRVEKVILAEGTEAEVLTRAASVVYLADFTVSAALVEEAKKRGLAPLPASKLELIPERGAKALLDGMDVRVGSPRLLIDEKVAVPVSFADAITELVREKRTVMVVLSGRSPSGAVVFSEAKVRESASPRKAFARFLPKTPVAWSLLGAAGLCVVIILFLAVYYLP